MNFVPKVSIIIPVFNGSKYLREAIVSSLAQTYKNIEIIIINDGSNDGGQTEEVAMSFGDKVRYFYKENGGVGSALNFGIQKMTGEYFSWLSHDDVYYPFKVERQIKYLEKSDFPKIILYSDYDCIDQDSRFLFSYRIKNIKPGRLQYQLVVGSPINGCTLLIPKICFEKVGVFDEKLKTTQDYDLWFRLAEHYQFKHIAEPLIQSRYHAEQGSLTIGTHNQECNKLYISFLNKLLLKEPVKVIGINSRSFLFFKMALGLIRQRFTEAANYALKIGKSNLKHDRFWMLLINISLICWCYLYGYLYSFYIFILNKINKIKIVRIAINLLKSTLKK